MGDIRDWVCKENEEALFLTEEHFDRAIVGVARRCGQPTLSVYDAEILIEVYMEQGMTYEEAYEFFEFNTVGAWHGENTPIFLFRAPRY